MPPVRRLAGAAAVLLTVVLTGCSAPGEAGVTGDGLPETLGAGSNALAKVTATVPSDWPATTLAVFSFDGMASPNCTMGQPVDPGRSTDVECVVAPTVPSGTVSMTVTVDGGPGRQISRTFTHTVISAQ